MGIPRAIATEKKTVAAMVRIYCAEHHAGADPLCATCAALQRYSHARLDACPYGADKPTCRECPIHCYKPAEREAMREVMRFAGPRMLLRHPWLSLVHLWKERFHRTPRRRSRSRVESPRHHPISPAGGSPPATQDVAGGDHVR